jgi:hypothetical protein
MVSSFPQTSSARLTGDPVSRIAQEYKEIRRISMLVPELISLRSAASARPSTSLAALSGISDMATGLRQAELEAPDRNLQLMISPNTSSRRMICRSSKCAS